MPSVLLAPVPHDEATAFIAAKPAVSREVFDGLVPELKARAITVTGIENANVVQNVRDRIADLPQGADWDAVKSDLVDQISPWLRGGEEGGAAAERRAETLMRAHGFQAYSGAMDQVMDRQKAAFPYAQYITAGDDKVRDSHAALNGLILPVDDPFWDTHTGPWEWGCRCSKVPMAADEVDEIRAAEADKPVEERRVVEGPRLEALSKNNQLTVADKGGVPRTVAVAPSKTFNFESKSLRLSADEIQARYSPEAWKTFETWSAKQDLGGGVSVLDWMKGAAAPSTPAAFPASTSSSQSTPATPANPQSEISKTLPQVERTPQSLAAPAGKPSGTPVSQALQVRTRLPHKADITTAIAAIDRVHGDGDLSKLSIYGTATRRGFGGYVHAAGEPLQIGIRNLPEQWPAMTTVHEIGHFLDHQVLGKAGEFASGTSPYLAEWRKTVLESQAVKQLAGLSASARGDLLKVEELWARSYAQYVALRSGDARLLAQLQKIHANSVAGRQWTTQDFEPIARAIDSLFHEKGWIK